jgi:hypothetical protein
MLRVFIALVVGFLVTAMLTLVLLLGSSYWDGIRNWPGWRITLILYALVLAAISLYRFMNLYETRKVNGATRHVSSEISRAKQLTAFAAGSDDLGSPPAKTSSLVAVSPPCFGGQEPVGNLPEPCAD